MIALNNNLLLLTSLSFSLTSFSCSLSFLRLTSENLARRSESSFFFFSTVSLRSPSGSYRRGARSEATV